MADEYLWDKSPPHDAASEVEAREVAALERMLEPLRADLPARSVSRDRPAIAVARKPSAAATFGIAIGSALATAVLIAIWVRGEAVVAVPAIVSPQPPAIARATDDAHAPVAVAGLPVGLPAQALPEYPTQEQIKAGIEPIKRKAKACGPMHGAAPGTRVIVKLSIAGATGRVTSSNATGGHDGTPLGQCIADAFAEARFPRFAKASVGVQYPITL